MTTTTRQDQQAVQTLLGKMAGAPTPAARFAAFKSLIWSRLSYDQDNSALPTRAWAETEGGRKALDAVAEPPVRFATAAGSEFHVIYTRLKEDMLSLQAERTIVERLLADHPRALFVFSTASQSRWHFLNVQDAAAGQQRRVFRRITVAPEEQLRTATERLELLDLREMPGGDRRLALIVQAEHDKAFDVAKVTQAFYEAYRRVFESVEAAITGIAAGEAKRLFTQRLFNRLMFLAFVQKKGWLKLDGSRDYLSALGRAYRRTADPDGNFYRDRLQLLFFSGLDNAAQLDLMGWQGSGMLQSLIGEVPYLNGGLFAQDADDRNPAIVVPDTASKTILDDLFACFNFTVMESTPLDVEVAVDPEMLGKVFEELVTGRHESGSYYTPKPIVSFMCREALKGYLETACPGETAAPIAAYVDEHRPQGLHNPEAVLDALRRVKVCDPACGSGAYLLGMLHELLDLRRALFESIQLDDITVYKRKLEIIQNNLYGVDLDEFAVHIARLRLWLSLAVDYAGQKPEPLPNLDFKIERGDSLIAPTSLQLATLYDETIKQYRVAKEGFLTSQSAEKEQLRTQVALRKQELIDWTHGGRPLAGFDWAVEFAEVFANGGGFDIVVANPPYVRQELIKDLKPALQKVYPAVYNGTADLYTYFYARAIQLLRSGGMLAFISSNKWFRANYGANLRKHIAETCSVWSITDFGDLPVFEGATAYPMIFVAQKGGVPSSGLRFTQVKSLGFPYPDVFAVVQAYSRLLPSDALRGSQWTLMDAASSSIHHRMVKAGVPLGEYINGEIYRGLLTGLNEAFVIDGATRAALLAQDPKTGEIIRPLFMGKDIRKWHASAQDRWLIFTPIGTDIRRYPAVFTHLKQWQDGLENRWDKGNYWWELRSCVYYDAFALPKIVFPDIAKEPRFALDTTGALLGNTAYIIPVKDLYLLGVLNSQAVQNFYVELSAQVRGGYLRFIRQYVEQIPIPQAAPADRAAIAALVQKCLDAQGVRCGPWEAEINERVARLYGLS